MCVADMTSVLHISTTRANLNQPEQSNTWVNSTTTISDTLTY